jgi:hypothetical protein
MRRPRLERRLGLGRHGERDPRRVPPRRRDVVGGGADADAGDRQRVDRGVHRAEPAQERGGRGRVDQLADRAARHPLLVADTAAHVESERRGDGELRPAGRRGVDGAQDRVRALERPPPLELADDGIAAAERDPACRDVPQDCDAVGVERAARAGGRQARVVREVERDGRAPRGLVEERARVELARGVAPLRGPGEARDLMAAVGGERDPEIAADLDGPRGVRAAGDEDRVGRRAPKQRVELVRDHLAFGERAKIGERICGSGHHRVA